MKGIDMAATEIATTVTPARTFAAWKKEAMAARKNYLQLAEELEANWPVWVKQQKTYATKDEACKDILGVTAAALRMRKARATAKANGEQLKADQRNAVTVEVAEPSTGERNAVTAKASSEPVRKVQPEAQTPGVLDLLSMLGTLDVANLPMPERHSDVEALRKSLDLVIGKLTVLRDRAEADAGRPLDAVVKAATRGAARTRRAPAKAGRKVEVTAV